MLRKYFQTDIRITIAICILIELLHYVILQNLVFSRKVMFNTLASELTIEQIEQGFGSRKLLELVVLSVSSAKHYFADIRHCSLFEYWELSCEL